MRQIILIAHNIRSCHNVGSLLRTADGLGMSEVILTGYTPYPAYVGDTRMPHEAAKLDRQIRKVALGAEKTVKWSHNEDVQKVMKDLKRRGFTVAALEQDNNSIDLGEYTAPSKIALIVGSEVGGLDGTVIKAADVVLEIGMYGQKESFNVAVAAAVALYHLRSR